LAVLGELNHRHGRWPVAHELMTESVRVAEDVGEGALLANCVCWLARVEAGLGNVDRARAHADRGLALCRAQQLGAIEPHAHYALGLLAMSQGEYGEAVRELAAIDPTDEFNQDPGLAIWEPERIEALVRTGRRDEAERQLERYERNVLRTNRVRGGAQLRRLRGLLGTDVELDEHFGDALEWHTRIDCPFEEARTRLAYGERLRRARRRSDAQAQLAAAQHTFDELGARLFAERARDELGAAGGRTAAAAAGPGDAADPWNLLTASERRVAEVIVGGATYNEAAAALFLSPRTIEHHLRQAYRKLGVRSRGELAARLTRRS
jgi:DNA-binding CsgD family transcriptional regulator